MLTGRILLINAEYPGSHYDYLNLPVGLGYISETLTSNGIEQYFSSTLRRSEKKKFRTLDSLLDFLRIQRIKNSNNFLDIISVLGLNFMQILRMFMEAFLII